MVDRTLRRILMLCAIVLIIWVIYLLKPVVIPFVGAFFIAYLFSPLVDAFASGTEPDPGLVAQVSCVPS